LIEAKKCGKINERDDPRLNKTEIKDSMHRESTMRARHAARLEDQVPMPAVQAPSDINGLCSAIDIFENMTPAVYSSQRSAVSQSPNIRKGSDEEEDDDNVMNLAEAMELNKRLRELSSAACPPRVPSAPERNMSPDTQRKAGKVSVGFRGVRQLQAIRSESAPAVATKNSPLIEPPPLAVAKKLEQISGTELKGDKAASKASTEIRVERQGGQSNGILLGQQGRRISMASLQSLEQKQGTEKATKVRVKALAPVLINSNFDKVDTDYETEANEACELSNADEMSSLEVQKQKIRHKTYKQQVINAHVFAEYLLTVK